MKLRQLPWTAVAFAILLFASCKGKEAKPSGPPPLPAPELQVVTPELGASGRADSQQAKLPKGYGVLTMRVLDPEGKPVEGAEIKIINKKGETFVTKSRKDGTTKGAGRVAENPFRVTVSFPGYDPQEQHGIALSETEPVLIAVRLERSRKSK